MSMAKLNLITGATGFIGTNLSKLLLEQGDQVIGIDNFSSSSNSRLQEFQKYDNFEFIEADITSDTETYLKQAKLLKDNKIDRIYNLACPASPLQYARLPLETIAVCTTGLTHMLKLAGEHDAQILQASTSEVYGDPDISPQPESYRGNVNTIGPRSCYDEGKRMGETICYEYKRLFKTKIKLIRIFNTYGPFMEIGDGRVISNFIVQALQNQDITIYGTGEQTRSFQYITDLISGITKFMETAPEEMGPVNIGNPNEFTIKELAEIVIEMTGSSSKISYKPLPQDDPLQRRPDISKAQKLLKWEPKVQLKEGLTKTIEYFKTQL